MGPKAGATRDSSSELPEVSVCPLGQWETSAGETDRQDMQRVLGHRVYLVGYGVGREREKERRRERGGEQKEVEAASPEEGQREGEEERERGSTCQNGEG